MKKKYGVVTSKIVTEYWEIEAENEVEAAEKLWVNGRKLDDETHDYRIEEIFEVNEESDIFG